MVRVGVVRDLERHVAPHVAAATRAYAARLAEAGARVAEVGEAVPDAWTAAHLDLQQAQAARVHARRRAAGQRYAPDVAARLDRGAALTDDALAAARATRRAAAATVRRWLGDHDVLLAPCAPDVAPRRDDADLAAQRAGLLACVVPLTQHGGPVLALPAGEHGGLPLGVQLTAAPGGEALLLGLACAAWTTA